MASSSNADEALRHAYDAAQFREQGHRIVDVLADYLAKAEAGAMPVLDWAEPATMLTRWESKFPESPAADFATLIARTLANANHLHHPHYMGHQVPPPLPMSTLADMVSSLLNNGMAVYEMGQPGVAMERAVVKWMGRTVGFDDTCDGVLTSGGSLGNLTAMLAMRRVTSQKLDGKLPAVLVSDQAHYSVRRAVKVMGWGDVAAIAVPSDAAYRMRADLLPEAMARAEQEGRRVVCVVGSACTTATGTHDPLAAIADFCGQHGLWFHVDAAHGGPAGLSEKYRYLLDGAERADSVVFDAHKMMMMSALVTGVIFRDGGHSFCAFDDRASYLIDKSPQEEWYNIGHRTMECTKLLSCLKVYTGLMCYGTKFFADYVTRQYDLARWFAAALRESGDFELLVEPDTNIVCFRYAPAGASDLDALNARVRKALVHSGKFYIVQVKMPQGLFLRVTLLNPLITEATLTELLAAIRLAV